MRMKFGVVLLLAALFFASALCVKQAPTWPSQYTVKGTFSIPYFDIVEPVQVWYDAVNLRERTDYYNGMDSYTYRFDQGVLYQVVPRVDKKICIKPAISGDVSSLTTVLPDLSSWHQKQDINFKGRNCSVFAKTVRNFNTTAVYMMNIDAVTSEPVYLVLYGYDFVFGSHPDIYELYYDSYSASVDSSVFDEPALCQTSPVKRDIRSLTSAKRNLGLLRAFTPPEDSNGDDFHHFMTKYHKVYLEEGEEDARRIIFNQNKKYIEEHNKRTDVGHKLAMNHLGDMNQEEMKSLITPNPKKLKNLKTAPLAHQMSGQSLPSEIDWVKLGAVTRVKDQGACGSCWTFGTTGSLEGSWFLKTGTLPSLSEQQIVDCAWLSWGGPGGDSGCDGGFASGAMQWVIDNGGISTEAQYPYLMQDSFCNATDKSSGVTISGYVNVTAFSEAALQDAVANYGPVAIAIDASHPSFTFYTEGVYFEPACGNTLDDLDHEVLAVGYGSENGQDYWLVKNSWSIYWGDMGFIKMARNRGNNCGIASQATYPVI